MERELGGQSLHVPANGLTSRGKANYDNIFHCYE
jgi:hypothetical protein